MQVGVLQDSFIIGPDDIPFIITNPHIYYRDITRDDREYALECWNMITNSYEYHTGIKETVEDVNSELIKLTFNTLLDNNRDELNSIILTANTLVYTNKSEDNFSGTWKKVSEILPSDTIVDQCKMIEEMPSNITIYSIENVTTYDSTFTLHSFAPNDDNLAIFVNNTCIKFK